MSKKRRDKVGKLLKKYLRSFPWRSCLLKNANWLRNSFHPKKKPTVYLHHTQMENTTDKKSKRSRLRYF